MFWGSFCDESKCCSDLVYCLINIFSKLQYIDEWARERTNERIYEQAKEKEAEWLNWRKNERADEQTNERMIEWTSERINERTNEWMSEWLSEWADE